MAWKSQLIKPYAKYIASNYKRRASNALVDQLKWMSSLLRLAQNTSFGIEHKFKEINDYEIFKKNIPLSSYEDFAPWLEKVFQGEKNTLWPGIPRYLAKTSGTTSGSKYIPISRDSINHHFFSAQAATLNYMVQSGNYSIMDGKMIFLSGSPELQLHHGIKCGRLSGIVNHHIPKYLSKNRLPSERINCIEDWEDKLEAIAEESLKLDLRLIGGIPPWTQMFFDLLHKKTGKKILEIFPNLKLLVHGGVNFSPYRSNLIKSLGKEIDMIETYPASEGFFAFQDNYLEEGLLLNTDAGIFYEFVPLELIEEDNPERLWLADVKENQLYALIVSTNSGLWSYNTGDVVKFVSTQPYKIVVSGRVKHQLSAFGEHVIAEEVEKALSYSCEKLNLNVHEFTVAPYFNEDDKTKPSHEWWVAGSKPHQEDAFINELDKQMCEQNPYYKDLRVGNVISSPKIRWVDNQHFYKAMKKIGKLGGQNKIPRLMNDRSFIELLNISVNQGADK